MHSSDSNCHSFWYCSSTVFIWIISHPGSLTLFSILFEILQVCQLFHCFQSVGSSDLNVLGAVSRAREKRLCPILHSLQFAQVIFARNKFYFHSFCFSQGHCALNNGNLSGHRTPQKIWKFRDQPWKNVCQT